MLLGVFALEAFNDVMVEVMKARMKHGGTRVGILANFYTEELQVEIIYNTLYI